VSSPLARIGVGLWTMRSPAFAPRQPLAGYRELCEDAQLIERLGFHSIWAAEHRLVYDGWCPMPLHALAAVAAVTVRLRLGSAVLILPQHDPLALARDVATLDQLSRGRVDLGVGLGHRDPEFDSLGLRRDRRGALMDRALDVLPRVWGGGEGDDPPFQRPGPPIWIGGLAPRALARAASRGHNLMLPQTLYPDEVRRIVAETRQQEPGPAAIGVLRDVWIEPDRARAAALRGRYERHFVEEAAWWVLKGTPALQTPAELERQLERIVGSALIGPAEEVAERLRELLDAGAELLCLRINFDMVGQAELHEQLYLLADTLPALLGDAMAV
jgi:alkanesulfonate monooxygenase SsuD/methylene tetrahydromethanopterin reductase-like flavin-dependent oxidoreductase (luciferase family)